MQIWTVINNCFKSYTELLDVSKLSIIIGFEKIVQMSILF